ncbi:hypothetical protein ACP275_02G138900 [Erythranthe tilingii]
MWLILIRSYLLHVESSMQGWNGSENEPFGIFPIILFGTTIYVPKISESENEIRFRFNRKFSIKKKRENQKKFNPLKRIR